MRNYWYPIIFSDELASDALHAVQLCGRKVVVFRGSDGRAACLEDACAHRSAPLSLGRLERGGVVECPYHGWRYDAQGKAVSLPTLPEGAPIPAAACVPRLPTQERLGLVWVYAGEADADIPKLPRMAVVEDGVYGNPEWAENHFTIDVDVHHSLVTENLLDPTHINFVHDGQIATREGAGPLTCELDEREDGFIFKHRNAKRGDMPDSVTRFVGPGAVRIDFEFQPGMRFVQSSYCVPIGEKRVRLLFRAWRDFGIDDPGTQARLQHHSEETFAQDFGVLAGLQANLDAGFEAHRVLVSEDKGCAAFRRWYAEHGQGI